MFWTGTPTGAPQLGHTERRAAMTSRALRRLPQEQTNLIDMTTHNGGARDCEAGKHVSQSEIQNPKSQVNSKSQITTCFEFGILNLLVIWDL